MSESITNFDWKAGWASLHKWLVAAVPYGFLVFLGFFFLLSQRAIIAESEEFSVPREWNKAISRLGIQPLYPPQEDFQVGDVYAVLVSVDAAQSRWHERAITIGHINLERELLAYHKRRSRLQQTHPDKPADWHLTVQDGSNVALRSIVFPGFQSHLDHSVQGSANLMAAMAAGRSQSAIAHNIRISNAMTYGIDPANAMAHLQRFCEQTQMCRYALLKQLFEHRHGSNVFPQREEDGHVAIDVHVVTRVFLTSELSLGSSRARDIGTSAAAGQPDQSGVAFQGEAAAREVIVQEGQMPRPVVFGFHRIGFAAIEDEEVMQ